jgi:hypothetical protein
MRAGRQPYAIAVALRDAAHGSSIDLEMISEIPTKIRRSLDGEAARGCMITRVSGARLRKGAQCTTENQHQKDFARQAVF